MSRGDSRGTNPVIREALAFLFAPGDVVELRIPKYPRTNATTSGYFNDLDKLAAAAARYSGRCPGVYVTLNRLDPALLARRNNRVEEYAPDATADDHIRRRCWLPMDFDPVRVAGVPSTDAEHEAALDRARECRDFLSGCGWPLPALGDSGNGGHLLPRIDLANNPGALDLVNRVLAALDWRFSDEVVTLDTSVGNAARIWKLYGTASAKGDGTPDRPHRDSRLLEVPDPLTVVPGDLLEAVAAMGPPDEPPRHSGQHAGGFDIRDWIARRGLLVAREGPWKGGYRWVLAACPFNPEHTDRSACIVQFSSGATAFRCHHNSCQGRNWQQLRELMEPGCYDRQVGGERRGPAHEGNGHAKGSGPGPEPAGGEAGPPPGLVFPPPVPCADLKSAGDQAQWLWTGCLARGDVTLLSALWKAGKTTLLAHLLKVLELGGAFCGRQVQAARVLYVTEESEKRWARRRDDLGLGNHVHFQVRPFRAAKPRRQEWAGLIDHLVRQQKAGGFDAVVLDTLSNLWPVRDENDAAEVGAALMPLRQFPDAVAVLLVHHLRKGDGQEATGSRGSGALTAFVDTILELRRYEAATRQDRRRVLTGYGRWDETPDEVVVELNPEGTGYTAHGDKGQMAQSDIWHALVKALPHEPPGMSTDELYEERWPKATRPHRGKVLEELRNGYADGRLGRDGTGKRNAPFTYWVTPKGVEKSPPGSRQFGSEGPEPNCPRTTPEGGKNDSVPVPPLGGEPEPNQKMASGFGSGTEWNRNQPNRRDDGRGGLFDSERGPYGGSGL